MNSGNGRQRYFRRIWERDTKTMLSEGGKSVMCLIGSSIALVAHVLTDVWRKPVAGMFLPWDLDHLCERRDGRGVGLV